MDPYVEKDMIDCLKSIALSLTEVNVRLEGIERAIKEANYMNDSDELEYADDEGEEEKELEKAKKEDLDEDEGDNPQAKFSVDEDETQTLEEFGGE